MKDNRLIEVVCMNGDIKAYRCSEIGISPKEGQGWLRVRIIQKGETFIFAAKEVTFLE